MRNFFLFLFAIAFSIITSCHTDAPDIDDINIDVQVLRFEKDILKIDTGDYANYVHILDETYGDFLPLYFREIVGLIGRNDTTVQRDSLLAFLNHPDVRQVMDSVMKKYEHIDDVEKDLTSALKHIKYYFPSYPTPKIITYIGGPPFCFNIDSDYLAIGLDGYMGPHFFMYQYFPDMFPSYVTRKFDKPYIVPNAVNVWLTGNFSFQKKENNLLEAMIYNGKILYAMKKNNASHSRFSNTWL